MFGPPPEPMEAWKPLRSEADLQALVERSKEVPCVIFKHSTRCGISASAKEKIESDWDFKEEEVEIYYLDLLAFRPVSNKVAEQFGVWHQSPQVILIKNGKALYSTSHSAISVASIRSHLPTD